MTLPQAEKTAEYRPDKADRITLVVLLVIVLLAAVERTFAFVYRLVDVLGAGPHTVAVNTFGLPAEARIADAAGSTPFPIDVASGSVSVNKLTSVESGYIIAEHSIAFIATLGVIAVLFALGRNTFRGVIFGKANTVLLFSGFTIGAAGYLFSNLFKQMASNEIINRLSGGHLEVWTMASGNPTPALLVTLAFAVILTAYAVGARIQRETEGLV